MRKQTDTVTASGSGAVILTGLAGIFLCLDPHFARAADSVMESEFAPRTDTLVVTGVRERRLAELSRSAAVVTAEDIALAPSTDIVDLLSRQANLTLRSFGTSEKFSGVDIRGQGETYTSNVLVLVDGIRLNSADLSGADYSVVPFDQIARIEVLRGANTVRYGNGAVGGVVNIITGRNEQGATVGIRGRAGSFSTVATGVDAAYASGSYSVNAGAEYFDTDGYRDNGELRKRDFTAGVGIEPVDWFTAAVGADLHRDDYGLPGPVSAAAFAGSASDRRASSTPLDGGTTDDDRLRADFSVGNSATGRLRVIGVTRDRQNDYVLGDPGTITEDSGRLDMQFERDLQLYGREHAVYFGVVADNVDYMRQTLPPGVVNSTTKRGDIEHRAWFAAADIALSERLKFSVGMRHDSFRLNALDTRIVDDLCDDPVFFPPLTEPIACNDPGGFATGAEAERLAFDSWRNEAYEAGLVFTSAADTNWFLSYAESFRNPNVDELIFAAADLGPQTGRHWDAGVRKYWTDQFELAFAVYYNETKNEILFGLEPGTNIAVNRNADEPVERTGGELDIRWYALSTLLLTANLGYTRAEFKTSQTQVPLVPEWTGGASAQAFLSERLTLTVTGNYIGRRFDGNDFNNSTYPRVEAYVVADTKLVYESGGLRLHAGIANLFDKVYATSVFSNQFYPMPSRNFYAGFSYRIQRS